MHQDLLFAIYVQLDPMQAHQVCYALPDAAFQSFVVFIITSGIVFLVCRK